MAASAFRHHELEIRPSESTVLLGMKGTGKTTLQEHIAHARARAGQAVVVWDPLEQYPSEISYVPRMFDDTDELDQLAGIVLRAGDACLQIEEAEQPVPNHGELPTRLKALAFMGRNAGCAFDANSRRPQQLNASLVRMADHVLIMKLRPLDREYMEGFVGRGQRDKLEEMDDWIKDPREGGGKIAHLDPDGQLHLLPRLQL